MSTSASPQLKSAVQGGEAHIPALDGLRGVAILVVLIYHFGGGAQSSNPWIRWFGLVSRFGDSGVTLFFVLSGFLITGILWDTLHEERALRNFYLRRALRIMPLYYGTLLLLLLVALAMGRFGAMMRIWWIPALYLQNIAQWHIPATRLPVPFWIGHYWSLAVEEHFYLVWPFLLLPLRSMRAAERLALSILVLSVAVEIMGYRWHWLYLCDYPFLTGAGALALGGLILFRHRSDPLAPRRWLKWFALASLGLFLAASLHDGTMTLSTPARRIVGHFGLLMLMGSLVWSCLQPGWIERSMRAAWLRWVGKISYGLYIYHLFFLYQWNALAQRIAAGHPSWRMESVRTPIAFFGSFLLAWLSYRFLERPILSLKHRIAPRFPHRDEADSHAGQQVATSS